jgi:class 3 adenylate cyclase/pimeloyl-ACP methyl ester carboxylesterase
MEPRIQYAKTRDGVSIAFYEIGSGPPCIQVPPIPFAHLTAQWADADYRAWHERLAEGLRLIVYDNRGSGLSDRDVADHSLEAYMSDIDAIADRLGLDQFAVTGICASGPVAIAYAAQHPERVSFLTLWCTAARGVDARGSAPALDSLKNQDWNMFTETVAHAMVAGWDDPRAARGFATIMRAATDAESLNRHDVYCADFDATPYLDRIQAPTLILHRKHSPIWPVEEGRKLAARIPNARLVLLEGGALLPYLDMDRSVDAIFETAGVPPPESRPKETEAPAPPDTQPGALQIILFTDLQGHTAMMQRLGDERGREVLREHERITRDALRRHSGREIKTIGDAFMASFGSAQRALECAIDLQRAFAEHNEKPPHGEPLAVRVGLNAGEPIAEGGDLFGNAVIAASRIAGLCKGREILLANVVRELVAGKGFLFGDRGDFALRGFEDPVRVWELRYDAR